MASRILPGTRARQRKVLREAYLPLAIWVIMGLSYCFIHGPSRQRVLLISQHPRNEQAMVSAWTLAGLVGLVGLLATVTAERVL